MNKIMLFFLGFILMGPLLATTVYQVRDSRGHLLFTDQVPPQAKIIKSWKFSGETFLQNELETSMDVSEKEVASKENIPLKSPVPVVSQEDVQKKMAQFFQQKQREQQVIERELAQARVDYKTVPSLNEQDALLRQKRLQLIEERLVLAKKNASLAQLNASASRVYNP